jgi:hypothetical protein
MVAADRFLVLCLLPFVARAATSANYSLGPAHLDAGGLAAASANYSINSSAGLGAAASSTDYRLRAGYAGQLADVVTIAIAEPSVPMTLNESATLQLGVAATYDDDTRLALPASAASWSVRRGPVTVGQGGTVTAGVVYQNTPSIVVAVYGNFSDTVDLSIVNTGLDDFAPYAADGLPDLWQVQYLGETSLRGGPSADVDGDGLNNLMEFAFGMNPTQGPIGALAWSGSTMLRTGVPILSVGGSGGASTLTAVFARRLDYLSANLAYTVEFSGDLVTWQASSSIPTVLAANTETQVVSVPFPLSLTGKKAAFFRLKIEVISGAP